MESLVEIGTESGIGARMKTLQHQLSGPFDLDSLRQAEIGLNGLLSLAELGLIEEEKQVQGSLRLATLASLKHEVRDDTLTRFSAYRLVRSLRERRRMTDLTGSIEGESTADALRHEFQSASRRLVSAWAMNPSLVQVLRYALDLWPSPELLEPVEQALMSKLDDSQQNSEFGRRVAYYVLADMFKAGATETGRESKRDLNFRIADVDSYRIALANLASRTLGRVEAPWYVQQQASLFLASVGKTATLPQAAPELRFHRALHSFVQAKSYAKDITVEEEVVVALVGH
ncbi:hypothetical protein JN27_23880 [Massilia sp. BSC265]|nr:hypothetical protein JN27_23880 [Massilia sp. BSC265]